ncbi:MAG: hypothetical protein GY757_35555 [bacterium]|nr:hypothetical protein [bacterium]
MRTFGYFSFFLISILLFIDTALPQTLPFRNYSEKDGLPSSSVNCIYQDAMGYLWIGTEYGLSRFDGQEFINFKKEDGLTNSYIISLLGDRAGNLWIGTRNGLYYLVYRRSDTNGAVATIKKYIGQKRLAVDYISGITEDREGILWLSSNNGLRRFDGKTFKTYTTADGFLHNSVNHISFQKDGTLLAAVRDGVCSFSKNRFSDFITGNNLPDPCVTKLLTDTKGRLWIGTKKGLSCLYKGKFTTYTTRDGLGHNQVGTIMEDREGKVWICTWNGLFIYSGGKFTRVTSKNGLMSNFVQDIKQDREGNIWVATAEGLSCLLSTNISNYSKKNGMASNAVNTIIEDRKGHYWFGTYEGLCRYSNGIFKTYTGDDGLISNIINDLEEDRFGNIWIATVGGLSVYSSGKFTNYTTKNGLASSTLFSLGKGRDGTIWVGGKNGVNRFDHHKNTFINPHFGMEKTSVFYIFKDARGDLWFSSDKGLYSLSREKKITHFTTRDGLPGNVINRLHEDSSGKIWIGTTEGLSCYHQGTFTNYSTTDGLADNKCAFILEDHHRELWIGTGNGLVRFNGKTFRTYSSHRHPFNGNYWTMGFKDSEGTFWLSNQSGVTRFTPPPVKMNRIPPPIYATGITVHGKIVSPAALRDLKHHQNYLKFNFVGLCYSAPESVAYKYRLKGIYSGWHETQERFVSYPYLPPGNYRFTVKAINNDGIESAVPMEIPFVIRQPFWKTWWFLSLIAMALLAVSLVIVLWKIKRTREKAILEERTRQLVMAQRMELMGTLATGAVHDLKNLLGVIIGYSKLAGTGPLLEELPDSPNEVIRKTATTAFQVVKQILSLTREHKQEIESTQPVELVTNIVEVLRVTGDGKIEIKWAPPQKLIVLPVNPTRFQQLVMNLCINAVDAMPGGGALRLSLYESGDQESEGRPVLLEIADTGTGMDEPTSAKIFEPLYTTKEQGKGTGLGLFVVKQIVEEFAGTIEVNSQPGKGTTFTIRFPENTAHLF